MPVSEMMNAKKPTTRPTIVAKILKVQRLFALVIHKGDLVFLDQPNGQRPNDVTERDAEQSAQRDQVADKSHRLVMRRQLGGYVAHLGDGVGRWLVDRLVGHCWCLRGGFMTAFQITYQLVPLTSAKPMRCMRQGGIQ